MAATTFMRTWQDFDLIFVVILPLFLFSATFYPIDAIRSRSDDRRATPLYQGVECSGRMTTGVVGPGSCPRRLSRGDGRRSGCHRRAAARPAPALGWPAWRERARRLAALDAGGRRLPALSASRRLARAVASEKVAPLSRRDRTGRGRSRASATRRRACSSSVSRRRPTAATGPGGSSPATGRATSSSPRSIAAGLASSPIVAPARRRADPDRRPDQRRRSTAHRRRTRRRSRSATPACPTSSASSALLPAVRVILALGAFGWDGVLRALAALGHAVPRPRAAVRPRLARRASGPSVLGSFHPSQQNTFTGKLTPAMLEAVIDRARSYGFRADVGVMAVLRAREVRPDVGRAATS